VSKDGRLAIVEDDAALRDQLVWALKSRFDVVSAGDAVSGLALLDSDPDLFLLDLRLPPTNEVEEGLSLLTAVRKSRPDATVLVMSGEKERKHALRAMELGAFDFFKKPFEKAELLLVVARALERRRLLLENRALKDRAVERLSHGTLVGKSASMKKLFAAIEKVAPTDATVLMIGESGTGKELVAQSLHAGSKRGDGAFVAVNCSALPESLAESELFGHERGAFTGAVAARAGKFELAHGGTLFLDEIATLAPPLQAKLLRVLETRKFERVGGTRTISVDIRLVAATNEDLEDRAKRGTFREDLFYRLNTIILRLPPLRERPEDIPLLVEVFADRAARRHGRTPKRFGEETLEALGRHPFRGNVRELEHLVEMLTLMVEEDEIGPSHLPGPIARADRRGAPNGVGDGAVSLPGDGDGTPLLDAVAAYERELLVRAIGRANGIKAQAARSLGLDANQMKYLCRKYRL
jgi:DNA-binding NtrC family response regulator